MRLRIETTLHFQRLSDQHLRDFVRWAKRLDEVCHWLGAWCLAHAREEQRRRAAGEPSGIGVLFRPPDRLEIDDLIDSIIGLFKCRAYFRGGLPIITRIEATLLCAMRRRLIERKAILLPRGVDEPPEAAG